MAIIKEIETEDGDVHANAYWNIESVKVEKALVEEVMTFIYVVLMRGWHSIQARQADKKIILREEVVIQNPEITEADNLYQMLYPLIKEDPKFQGATDA